MGTVIVDLSVSLDGFVAGADDGRPGLPLGRGGEALFTWMDAGPERNRVNRWLKPPDASKPVVDEWERAGGAIISGRRTFDIAGGWKNGHPIDVPIFVVTHEPPSEGEWSPRVEFVTDGVERALELAQAVAGERTVAIGGASVAQQLLRLGKLDEIQVSVTPVLLGSGVRLLDQLRARPGRARADPGRPVRRRHASALPRRARLTLAFRVMLELHGPIGLGTAAIGRPAYINLGRDRDLGAARSRAEMEQRAHAVMDAAWDSGVRYFDAARSYGVAEEFLASWLDARGPGAERPTIGSKWGYTYTGGWSMTADVQERKDLSAATFRRQLGETRALLGDRLDVYQIHSATIESGVLDDREVLAELAALRATGVAIGLSVTGPRQADTIDRALAAGGFDTVQATWNVLEPSAGAALQRAHDAGLRVIVKEAVANGRLTQHGQEAAWLALAAERGLPPDALAIAAAIAQPWSDVVLSGAVSPAMLASNLRARGLVGEGADVAAADGLAIDSERYWRERSELAWS